MYDETHGCTEGNMEELLYNLSGEETQTSDAVKGRLGSTT